MAGANSEEANDGDGIGGAGAGGFGVTGTAGVGGAGEGRDTVGGLDTIGGGVTGINGAGGETGVPTSGLAAVASGVASFFIAGAGATSPRSCFSSRSSAYKRVVRSAQRD